ncbi:TetR/AcrR family transcriptional regulator [Sphingobium sp. H39-3-25]|nr:TetR/AcrR family transcriptional regulator [Sphingobium arseniciresistens]
MLDGAAACFFRQGYDGTSITDIIEQTGGSRGTIYSLFGSKRGLFEALIQDRLERIRPTSPLAGKRLHLAATLVDIADQLLGFVTAKEWLDLVQLVLPQVPRESDLGVFIYDAGIAPIEAELHAYFTDWRWIADSQSARPEDLYAAFSGLVVADLPLRLLAGVAAPPSGGARRQHLERAVSSFLLIAGPLASAGVAGT